MGTGQRSIDPASIYAHGMMQSKPGMGNPGKNIVLASAPAEQIYRFCRQ